MKVDIDLLWMKLYFKEDILTIHKIMFFVFKASLEGPVHDLSTEFSNFVFPFLISWMVNMGICNALLKFRSQISSYKKDT